MRRGTTTNRPGSRVHLVREDARPNYGHYSVCGRIPSSHRAHSTELWYWTTREVDCTRCLKHASYVPEWDQFLRPNEQEALTDHGTQSVETEVLKDILNRDLSSARKRIKGLPPPERGALRQAVHALMWMLVIEQATSHNSLEG